MPAMRFALRRCLAVLLFASLLPAQDPPDLRDQFTERASKNLGGFEGDSASESPRLSRDGRYAVFTSLASNLTAAGSFDGGWDVFRKDLRTGEVVHVSRRGAIDSNGNATQPAISPDGRYVAYASDATNLIAGGTPAGITQVYLADVDAGTTTLVSQAAGQPGTTPSDSPDVAEQGAFVAFRNRAGSPARWVVVRVELSTNAVTLVSRALGGGTPNGDCDHPRITADGRYVVYDSVASNLVTSDINGVRDVFLWDRATSANTMVTRNGAVQISQPATAAGISDDARRVLFLSAATELAGYTGGFVQAQLADRPFNLTYVVSVGPQPADRPCNSTAISRDGTRVAFATAAVNLGVANPARVSLAWMIVLGQSRPRLMSQSDERVLTDQDAVQVNLSGDGVWVAFASAAALLEPRDFNGLRDVFVGYAGHRNFAPAGYGPGIWRGIRPSRLLEQVGLYRPTIRDFAVEPNPGAGCYGELLVTVVHEVNGLPVVVHGTLDCAGSFVANNHVAAAVGTLDVISASTSDDGRMLLLTTPTQTLIATRTSAGVPFGTARSLNGVGTLGHARVTHELNSSPRTANIYFTDPVTDASSVKRVTTCEGPPGQWSCGSCSPPTCTPVTEVSIFDLGGLVRTLEPVVVSGTNPRGMGTQMFLAGSESGRGGLYFRTAGAGFAARSATVYLFENLWFTHGSMALGRVFMAGSDGRPWELEVVSQPALRASAVTGDSLLLLPTVPAEWINHGGVWIFAAGYGPPTPPLPPLAGTQLGLDPLVFTWQYVPPGSPPGLGLQIPGGFGPTTIRTQYFVGNTLRPLFYGSNLADLDYR